MLYVHTSPNCTIEEIHTIDLMTRLRSTQSFEHKDGDSQHRIFDTPLAETPKSVHECIKGNTTTEAKLALRIGYLTAAQAEEIIEGGTPQRSLTALTAKLENTCLTHTHKVWNERNKTPDLEKITQDTHHRIHNNTGRNKGVTIDTEDTSHKKTIKWERDRKEVISMKRRWESWDTLTAPNMSNTGSKRTQGKETGTGTPTGEEARIKRNRDGTARHNTKGAQLNPTKEKTFGTESRKKGRQPHTPNITEHQLLHMFLPPTATQHSMASVAIARSVHLCALTSSTGSQHSWSSAVVLDCRLYSIAFVTYG